VCGSGWSDRELPPLKPLKALPRPGSSIVGESWLRSGKEGSGGSSQRPAGSSGTIGELSPRICCTGGGGGGEPLSLTARELASALYPFSSLAGGRAAVAAIRLHRAAERDRGERAESVLAAAAGGDDGPAPRRCRGSPSRACAWFATARTLRAGRSSPRAVACGRSFAPRWAS